MSNSGQSALSLNIDDTLLIFSDGLIEASGSNHEEFGMDRLISTWRNARKFTAQALVHALGDAIRQHSEGPFCDDLTILALRGRAAQNSEAMLPSRTTAPSMRLSIGGRFDFMAHQG